MTEPNDTDQHSVQEGRSQRDAPKPSTEHDKDRAAQDALDRGDKEKIDKTLDQLNVTTTESGKDQSRKPDTEGSNSSSKNLDEQND